MKKFFSSWLVWFSFMAFLANTILVIVSVFLWSLIAVVGLIASWILVVTSAGQLANWYKSTYIDPIKES